MVIAPKALLLVRLSAVSQAPQLPAMATEAGTIPRITIHVDITQVVTTDVATTSLAIMGAVIIVTHALIMAAIITAVRVSVFPLGMDITAAVITVDPMVTTSPIIVAAIIVTIEAIVEPITRIIVHGIGTAITAAAGIKLRT